MSIVSDLVGKVGNLSNCHLFPVTDTDFLPKETPPDLREFYCLCGGAVLFDGSDYMVRIVPPGEIKPSNEVILGEQFPEDRSSSWFIVAECSPGEYVSIDMSKEKAGWCYDSFCEVHGVAGSCAIISKSFSEFFENLLNGEGGRYFWLSSSFRGYGDAYDN